jgi:DNA-nicking Smr family endonuclease
MARRRRASLSQEDRDLWSQVAQSVAPLKPEKANLGDLLGSAAPAPLPDRRPKDAPAPVPAAKPQLPKFRVGSRAASGPPVQAERPASIIDNLRNQTPRVDAKTIGKMRKGKLRPEGRIDLHGMTLNQAHPALLRFIHDSYTKQRRLVLVITGKGKDRDEGYSMPVPRGVLRHQVPHWLHAPQLAPMVLQVLPAHLRHGGEGAYYVYLKRKR